MSFLIILINWHGVGHPESSHALKFQFSNIPTNKTTPALSVLLPSLSTFPPYHAYWENTTLTCAIYIPNPHLCDTTAYVETVVNCQLQSSVGDA
jgi:hypothetical protein